MKKLYFLIFFLMSVFTLMAQTHFVPAFIGNGTDHMNIYIVSAQLGNETLEAGDEIAAFDGNICCGVLVLTQPVVFGNPATYQQVNPSKNEGTGNGYTPGHAIAIRIWDASAQKEYSAVNLEFISTSTGQATDPIPYTVGETAVLKISAEKINNAPVANAGPDQAVNEGTIVTLDGSASSDPDNDAITYQWTAPAGVNLSSTTVAKPTFMAPQVNVDTDLTFTLVVNDGTVNSTSDQVVVKVKQVNKVPVANAGPDQTVNEGVVVTLDGSASFDGDNENLVYTWTAPVGINLSATNVAKPTFTAPEVTADTDYTFSLVVNDGHVNSTADEVKITVKQVNKIPVANAGPDQTVDENTLVTLDGSASSDGDGDALSYIWTAPNGVTLSDATVAKPTFTAAEVTVDTELVFSLKVNDGKADSPVDEVKITVKQVNKIPVANAGPDQVVNENTLVTLDGSASSDGDGDALTYLWVAPGGVTLSDATAAKPTFTAAEVTVDTDLIFSLKVNDGKADSPIDLVKITVKQVNRIPVANAGPDQQLDEGALVTLDGSASTDGDGDALTYLWTAPNGITLNDATAVKPTFIAPEVNTDTDFIITLVVNDGTDNSPADEVKITVQQLVKHPVANAGPDQEVNEATLVTLDGAASILGDGTVLSYLWTAPAGITLSDPTAMQPTFTAPDIEENKTLVFTLVVHDGLSGSTPDEVQVTVKQVNKAPTANAGMDQTVDENTEVTLDGSASSDPDALDVLTYLWTAPAGITLNDATAQKPTFTAPEVAQDTEYIITLVVNDGKVNSPADAVKVLVKQVNKVPVANAGPDQSVPENTVVTLDGSTSTDGDGDNLTYLWTAPQGITLSANNVAKPTFMAPEVAANTPFIFTLVVNDGLADSPADQVVITVQQVNKIPVANAGPDQTVDENTQVTLSGLASSDGDGDALTYLWSAPAGISLSSNTVAQPTFIAPEVMADTDFIFTLKVNDGKADSQSDEVIITVKQVNKAPVANAGPDQVAFFGNVVTLDGTASSDFDQDALTYLWTSPAGITLNDPTAAKPTFDAPDVSTFTNFVFTLVVNDGALNSAPDEVNVLARPENKIPVANAGPDQVVNENTMVSLDGSLSADGDNDPITYKWTVPAGITLNLSNPAKPTFMATEVDVDTEYRITLVVNDGFADSPADEVLIKVLQVNTRPVANAGMNQNVTEGALVTLDGTGSTDPDGDPMTYLWTAPAGITLNSNTAAKPTFTAPEIKNTAFLTFTLVVNDGFINSTPDQVTIIVENVNKAPVANAGPDQEVNEGLVVTLDGSASADPDEDALTYTWTAPAGITLSASNVAKPTFTAPEVTEATTLTFTLVVSDGLLNSQIDEVVVTVNHVNKVPVANAGPDKGWKEGALVTLDASLSSDPDGNVLTYLWTAPAGIELNDATAVNPTFTAPAVEENLELIFTLVVNDGSDASKADTVIITILDDTYLNKTPVANAGPDQTVNEGTMVALDGSASSDADVNDKLTFAWTAPKGITLNNAAAMQPTFTAPEVKKDTIFMFILVVNDGIETSLPDTMLVTIKQVNKAPVASAGADQTVLEAVLVTLNGSASMDPDGDALTYLWTAPTGIQLSNNKAMNPSFTAPVVDKQTSFTFVLIVNDGKVNSLPDEVIVTVKPANKPPVAKAGPDQNVVEGAIVTLDGSASVDPEGKALTYQWTAPANIVLSSATAVKPTFTAPEVSQNTALMFTLIVKDGELSSVADTVIINIKSENKVPVANAGPDQQVAGGAVVTLDASASTDPDGDALTYLWTAPAGITLSSTTAVKPSFTAPSLASNTSYTFTLVVNDGIANSAPDQVKVDVQMVNVAPVADAGTDQTVDEGTAVTLNGSASSDANGDALTYLWTAPAGITLSDPTAARPSFSAPEVDQTTAYTFNLVVNDGKLNSVPDAVVVTVNNVVQYFDVTFSVDMQNELVAQNGVYLMGSFNNWSTPIKLTKGEAQIYSVSISIPERTTVNYRYYNGNPAGLAGTWEAESFSGTCVDENTTRSIAIWKENVNIPLHCFNSCVECEVNQPPVAVSGKVALDEDASVVFWLNAYDFDDAPEMLTFNVVTEPANASSFVLEGRKVTFKPVADFFGNDLLTFEVSDASGNVSNLAEVKIVVRPVNDRPVALPVEVNANNATSFEIDLSAYISDKETAVKDLKVSFVPGDQTAGEGVLGGTITHLEGKRYLYENANPIMTEDYIVFRVSDGELNAVAQVITIEGLPAMKSLQAVANGTSIITVSDSIQLMFGESVDMEFIGIDRSFPFSQLDIAIVQQPAYGTLSNFGPDEYSGSVLTTYHATYEATSNENVIDSVVYTVSDGVTTITAVHYLNITAVKYTPALSAVSPQNMLEDEVLVMNLPVTDEDTDVSTLSWEISTSPKVGFTFEVTMDNGQPMLQVTPPANYFGSSMLHIVVTDSDGLADSVQFSLTVQPVNDVPVCKAETAISTNEDESFELIIPASDGDNDQLEFTFTNLPAWITSSSESKTAVKLSGTPGNDEVGQSSFGMNISDGKASIDLTFDLVVVNVDDAPYVVAAFDSVKAVQGDAPVTLQLGDYFGDIDAGDVLSYAIASNSNADVVQSSISNETLTLTFSETAFGLAKLMVEATAQGVSASSELIVKVDKKTGVAVIAKGISILAYPNPVSDVLNIQFEEAPETGTLLQFINEKGQRLIQKVVNEQQCQLNLGEVPAGIYLLEISNTTGKVSQKVIVQ